MYPVKVLVPWQYTIVYMVKLRCKVVYIIYKKNNYKVDVIMWFLTLD